MTAGKGQATRQGSERAVRRFAAVAAVASADLMIAPMADSTWLSATTSSILIFGRKSTVYSLPR